MKKHRRSETPGKAAPASAHSMDAAMNVNYEIAPRRNPALISFSEMLAFVAVVNATSFTGAARQLGTSKSVISRRISEIELQLGTQLIDRSGSRISVTDVGNAYYERCVSIIESVEAANDLAAGFNGGIHGTLRVSVPHFYGAQVLAPLFNEFASIYSGLRIDLGVEECDAGGNGTNYDLSIRIGHLANSSLLAKRLGATRSWICASPEYLAARGTPKLPGELAYHDCLVNSGNGTSAGWQLLVEGELRTARVRERIRSPCCFQLLQAARSGLGLALLPDYVIADAIATGRLKVVMPDCAPPAGPVSLVYPSSRRSSLKVQALIGFLSERLAHDSLVRAPIALA
ncbi:LysR family transcriptional regulator [Lysobacter sp. ESA13C]|nr:LysR family transcriptional regulator [Lysobacter sp. ESA13C]